MNENKWMDKVFQDRLEEYASPTPDHLWDKIATQTQQQDTQKPSPYIWIFSLLVLLGSLLMSGLFFSKNTAFTTANSTSSNPTLATSKVQAAINNTNDNSGSIKNSNIKSIASNHANTITAVNNTTKLASVNNTAQSNTTQTNNNSSFKGAKNLSNNDIFTEKTGSVQLAEIQSVSDNKENTVALNATFDIKKNLTPVSEEQQTTFLESERTKLNTPNDRDIRGYSNSPQKFSAALSVVPLFVSPNDTPDLSAKLHLNDPKCGYFNREKLALKHYMDIGVGLHVPFKQLRKNGDSEYLTQYIIDRKKSENYKLTTSLQLRYSLVHHTGIALSAGITYTRIMENVAPNNTDRSIAFINQLGSNNNFTLVDIPISLGYEWEQEDYTLSIRAGVLFNLMYRANKDGYILTYQDDDDDIIPFSIDDDLYIPVFKNQLEMGYIASIAWHRQFNDNVALIIEPQARFYNKSVTVSTYQLSQKYFFLGASASLRYKF